MTKEEWALVTFLHDRFLALWARVHAEGDPEVVFANICQHYREMGRHYHVLEHLAHCLRELDLVRSSVHDVDAVEFFIFFHDYIYIFSRDDNEKQSAIRYVHIARRAHIPDLFNYKVSRMILASKHHRAETLGCKDLALALDIDIAILGAEPDVYDCYMKDIRKEYRGTYTDKEFTIGRMGWILGMLNKKNIEHQSIFLTQTFQEKYEERAMANLNRELVELQNRQ